MACSNYWTSVFQVGSHHLAREFLKLGYEIAFISDPISPLHLLASRHFKDRFAIYRNDGIQEDSLWSYVPATLLPPYHLPLLQSEWVHRHWHQWTFPSVVKKVKQRGFQEVDILYFDTAIQSFWLDHIEAKRSVFRIADYNLGFKKFSPALKKLEEELIERVDIAVCTAKNLQKLIPKAKHLPNGVPIEHFSKQPAIPAEYSSIPKPIALYVGAIEEWFHFDLLKELSQTLPEVSFVLIGPIKKNPFEDYQNIHVLGPRSYCNIPAYMAHANVGLIPFDVENFPELIHNVNPLKLYEYMACGLPVVATHWQELEAIQSPAFLCKTANEFKNAIQSALANPDSSPHRNYAKQHDWSIRAKLLIELLENPVSAYPLSQ